MSSRTLPVRRLAVAAIAPLLLTTLAACGGDDASTAKNSTSPSTSTSPAATEEPDVAVPEGEEIEPAAFMDLFESTFADATTVRVALQTETMLGSMTGEGEADYSATPPEIALTLDGGMMGEGTEAVLVEGVMYLRSPELGDDYLRLDLNDPNNPLGSAFTDQLDPRAMFEQLEGSLESVVYEGEREVDGDSADAYTVSVDATDVLEGQGQAMPPGMDLPEAFTYTVFFADGLFRRMEIAMGDTLGQMTMDFTDWGTDVEIEAPPADQVTDFPDLGSLMPSAGASS